MARLHEEGPGILGVSHKGAHGHHALNPDMGQGSYLPDQRLGLLGENAELLGLPTAVYLDQDRQVAAVLGGPPVRAKPVLHCHY